MPCAPTSIGPAAHWTMPEEAGGDGANEIEAVGGADDAAGAKPAAAPGAAATSAAAAAAMNNPMFDPLHIHAEGAAAHANQSHSNQGSDPHGLNEFLRWAFENGTDEC